MTQPSEPKNDAEFAALAFSTLPEVAVSAELSRRIAQIPLEHEFQGKVWYWPFDRVWQPSLALAALALMGVLTGSVFDIARPTTGEVAELLNTQPSTMPTNAETSTVTPGPQELATADDDETSDDAASEGEDEDEMDNLFALALGESWQETVWDTLPESSATSP